MTEKNVRDVINRNDLVWENFIKWMRGQTCGVYPNGDTDWYEYDVDRYIRIKKKGDKDFWD